MNDFVKWIKYKDKKKLYINVSGLKEDTYMDTILEYEKEVLAVTWGRRLSELIAKTLTLTEGAK